jgi:tetratricopeptide (TPR) repeat protein/transcriptional regulator with XRE-family HTH domain
MKQAQYYPQFAAQYQCRGHTRLVCSECYDQAGIGGPEIVSNTRHNPTAFGDLLRRYRQAAALSQEELAERARMSARAVSDLERGLARTPRRETVQLLAEALRLDGHDRAALAAARVAHAAQVQAGTKIPVGESVPGLVGRDIELALLERHLAGDGPPLLLFAGEPGIGKSRLLREAARRAIGHGLQVVADGCQRRGGQEPFAPLLGAIKRCIASRPPARLRADLRGCAWLVRLLPELAETPIEPLPAWTLLPEQERRLMFEATAHFLANVAGPSGTLLVLDDLQWAGPDALDLLATLARDAAERPLRIVGAYRDTEAQAGDPLSAMLADLALADLAIRCPIGPLNVDDARHLLATQLAGAAEAAPALQDHVLKRAGGVPLFLINCARAVDGSAPDGDGGIPWSLAQSVKQRVALLPAPAAEVLAVAALIGRSVPHALLLRVAGQPEEAVFATLEAARHARLLHEEGQDYQFTHDLIREVLEEQVGAARRAALHRRIAEALEAGTGDPPLALLAYHFDRGGDRRQAARYLEEAGDRAQTNQAHGAAAGYFLASATYLQQLGQPLDMARVRLKLGTVLSIQARYEAALVVLEQAAAAFHEAGDRTGLARTLARIGAVHSMWGTYVEGLARLQVWLEPLQAGGPMPGLAALYAVLSDLHYMCGQLEEAVSTAEQGASIAEAAGDEQALADAQTYRGVVLNDLGRRAEAREALIEAIRLGEAAGTWATLPFALEAMARLAFSAGEFDACRRYIDRTVTIAEQRGDPYQLAAFLTTRGLIIFRQGDWTAARADLERGLAVGRQAGTLSFSAFLPLYMVPLCLATGDWTEAARLIDESMALPDRDKHPFAVKIARGLLAELDLLEGHPEAARARIITLPPAFYRGVGHAEFCAHGYGPLLALAQLELGDQAAAARVVAETIARARLDQTPLVLTEALRVAALIDLRQERLDEVTASLDEAIGIARRLPYPYQEARLLSVYGQMHAQQGAASPARECLEAALAIFRRLGARVDVERIEQALTTLD